ncbi:MAG: hypothetical protein H0U57_14940 [Tatlockia sp.]|nr:hypothetical protein [Tatlockia sp.]
MPKFQKLFIEIPSFALCHPREKIFLSLSGNRFFQQELQSRLELANERANTSPLYWLSISAEGREIFANLLKKNPLLATSVDSAALTRERSTKYKGNGETPLDLLLYQEQIGEGNSILELLSKYNPELTKLINLNIKRLQQIKNEQEKLPPKKELFSEEIITNMCIEKGLVEVFKGKDLPDYLAKNFELKDNSGVELLTTPSSLGLFSENRNTVITSTKTETRKKIDSYT